MVFVCTKNILHYFCRRHGCHKKHNNSKILLYGQTVPSTTLIEYFFSFFSTTIYLNFLCSYFLELPIEVKNCKTSKPNNNSLLKFFRTQSKSFNELFVTEDA